ncbi:Ca2+-binding RTX toxin-like protein [Sulfitobacter undariae]|uniref:Ca2+-binding RTX toxin-like protein n=1 Tax=Sulfitobacter undariae TaxID=1563671 RepID=A0A7W6H0R8_9RHOB|nr:calcium-binding protein [Sulfitobacter undariae]MBB3994367.1 Ca2+-binding RTX toxin-like protein [Sulfitobacter undariae]
MLWLAGLMGLMGVGAVSFVEPHSEEEEDTTEAQSVADATSLRWTGQETSQENAPVDNYDPRGGDDAALLGASSTTQPDQIILKEGTNGADTVAGTPEADHMRGRDGSDVLNGGNDNDALYGDGGDDTLNGDGGNDTLHGDHGGDALNGGADDDVLFGHSENDTLSGDAGDDYLQGSAGDDELAGGDGDDTLQGGLDNDTIVGGLGADLLFGGWGNDVLSGVVHNASAGDHDSGDFLNGGGGDDSILAGAGDIITAGSGADEIVLGDWITSGEAAQILDYAPEEDNIVLLWDDSAGDSAEPQISLSDDPDTTEQTLILMDGAVVAVVNGSDLELGDITLIPYSTATHLGLTA